MVPGTQMGAWPAAPQDQQVFFASKGPFMPSMPIDGCGAGSLGAARSPISPASVSSRGSTPLFQPEDDLTAEDRVQISAEVAQQVYDTTFSVYWDREFLSNENERLLKEITELRKQNISQASMINQYSGSFEEIEPLKQKLADADKRMAAQEEALKRTIEKEKNSGGEVSRLRGLVDDKERIIVDLTKKVDSQQEEIAFLTKGIKNQCEVVHMISKLQRDSSKGLEKVEFKGKARRKKA